MRTAQKLPSLISRIGRLSCRSVYGSLHVMNFITYLSVRIHEEYNIKFYCENCDLDTHFKLFSNKYAYKTLFIFKMGERVTQGLFIKLSVSPYFIPEVVDNWI